ncbi:trans-sulfuration enzyme family protein [Gracilibacillus alcaliphilus]|uniref:trans-sulfuration enzyme family protein n=1 Tax=Gracilibacillus alcaliphilus TaxID=1401441 RepID=UPI001956D52B|nr:aminotransferase class I/II-fold pyridoxal phosphate-dependent enzyme [Gracilibacillus alcaliphilus]MBM7677476.1 cystathionine beta-lyase [Gracilibacillus alcaliphilus]
MKDKTMLVHFSEEDSKQNHGAVVPPIYQNSLFVYEDWDAIDQAFDDPVNNFLYTRGKNPSVSLVEEKLAKLAHGEKAKLFASGMGAISAAILHFVKANDHIVTVSNVYGPTNNFIKHYLKEKCNIDSTYVSGKRIEEFEQAIQPNTTLIYLESPSSALFSLQDVEAVVQLAKQRGIHTVIDNTWASPIFQKPLDLGVDLEVHSCSKYIGGHSDVVAGVVIGKTEDIDQLFLHEAALLGAKMSPFESWLILRSLRTLKIRMKEHQENALQVAQYLESHPKVSKVHYPGLPSFDQYQLGQKQMSGYSGLFAFELRTEDVLEIKKFVNSLSYFKIGVSWGGHESLVYVPAISYLKELTPQQFKEMGISLGTVRLSIGLEDAEDLIADLDQALGDL